MAGVALRTVAADDADLRLDRWFKRHYPALTHGRLEKLLRTGQVRVDGRRAKAGQRLEAGQSIRVPPLDTGTAPPPKPLAPERPAVSAADASALKASILWQDELAVVVNKPPGLPVQGGTRSERNLDAMLDALADGAGERPRLVHRLDKDTSGVLLLARSASAAAKLTEAFRRKTARKLYWALVAGAPKRRRARIDAALAKRGSVGGERVIVVDEAAEAVDEDDVKHAATRYATVDHAGNKVAWLAMMPLTGRTHQLRVHAAALGTPIVGDGKYGGRGAFLSGRGLSNRLHLHARRLILPHPKGGVIDVAAPLPDHMRRSWETLGFDPEDDGDPFGLGEATG